MPLKISSRPDFEKKSVEEIEDIVNRDIEAEKDFTSGERLNVEEAVREQKVRDFLTSDELAPKYDRKSIKAKGPVKPITKKIDSKTIATMIARNLGLDDEERNHYLVNKVTGERFIIGKTVLRIGSSKASSNVVLNNKAVSRKHAIIEVDDKTGCILATDLGSTNGTYLVSSDGATKEKFDVNESYEMYPGDTIVFANEEFEIK